MTSFTVADGGRNRVLLGSAAALVSIAVFGAVMFALRSHLSVATVALVLVLPVVIGVVVGGVGAGIVAVAACFLVYDYAFIPPYYTLTVGSARNWVALAVYVAVVFLVARVVDRRRRAEDEARKREADAQRLLELSELLIQNRPMRELLPLVVSVVRDAFECEGAVLLLPRQGHLEVVADAGRELTPAELRRVSPEPGVASSLTPPTATGAAPGDASTETIVLSSPGRPVGLIGLAGAHMNPHRRDLARALGNNIAVALERAQLQEQALRLSVLEEVDRLRGALVGAVSHDLRTPLATIKASASTLLDAGTPLEPVDRVELLELIDEQADRLGRLVTNLLDMSRIETGSLVVDRQPLDIGEVVAEAVGNLRPLVPAGRVAVRIAPGVPIVEADHVLIGQVVANLVENALRYGPEGTSVLVTAERGPAAVDVAVTDHGPGFPEEDRLRVFGLSRVTAPTPSLSPASSLPREERQPMAASSATTGSATTAPPAPPTPAGGSGVGLAIAKAFVEAHGGTIWAENLPAGGARVTFRLPLATAG